MSGYLGSSQLRIQTPHDAPSVEVNERNHRHRRLTVLWVKLGGRWSARCLGRLRRATFDCERGQETESEELQTGRLPDRPDPDVHMMQYRPLSLT